MNSQIIDVTEASFDAEVLQSTTPVLVDFWADWCGPCRRIAPMLEALAKEYAGRVLIRKISVDTNKETADRYKIRSIPTLLLFKEGEVSVRLEKGIASKAQLIDFLDGAL